MDDSETLLEFPCRFPIKMMGRAGADFGDVAVQLVERHVGQVDKESVHTASSSETMIELSERIVILFGTGFLILLMSF